MPSRASGATTGQRAGSSCWYLHRACAVAAVLIRRILPATGMQRAMPSDGFVYVRFRYLKALPSRLESTDPVLAALVIHSRFNSNCAKATACG